MPCDIDAAVIANTRLSADYSVLSLDAPAIAGLARPGQFVMVKPSRGADPLLRRPFSIFEVLRNADGIPAGISLLNKRVGIGTQLLYQAEPGSRIACPTRLPRAARRAHSSTGRVARPSCTTWSSSSESAYARHSPPRMEAAA
jgi:NAD(P)H-flavin reductase